MGGGFAGTYTINTLARVTSVRVLSNVLLALDDSEGGLRNELVESVWGAGELLASIAVTIMQLSVQDNFTKPK